MVHEEVVKFEGEEKSEVEAAPGIKQDIMIAHSLIKNVVESLNLEQAYKNDLIEAARLLKKIYLA